MKNEPRPTHHRKEHAPARTGRCIALIDSNYMAWLLRQTTDAATEPETYNRMALIPSLAQALKGAGLGLDDDDRLTAVIDDAQLHGLSVYVLADESARHMDQLVTEDPAWCRLLAQADRRVLLLPQAARELTAAPRAPAAAAAPQDPEVVRTKLLEVVSQWWDDEPEDLREDLRDELRGSHGIPQEVDRHMLLRVRRALDRPLSFPEKKILREMVRSTVLGITEESMPV
ncbi:MAG: hypothetical protein EBW49_11035 [Betaproteobacteria bacterium]|nr:hypothetical protein [Betaproteobacteria bacterium]